MGNMTDAVTGERKATRSEVRAHADAIKHLAAGLGLADPRVRHDGAAVVHSDEPGYRSVNRLSTQATQLVGAYVHVITDDVPGAVDIEPL